MGCWLSMVQSGEEDGRGCERHEWLGQPRWCLLSIRKLGMPYPRTVRVRGPLIVDFAIRDGANTPRMETVDPNQASDTLKQSLDKDTHHPRRRVTPAIARVSAFLPRGSMRRDFAYWHAYTHNLYGLRAPSVLVSCFLPHRRAVRHCT